jgi:hypothetical protein
MPWRFAQKSPFVRRRTGHCLVDVTREKSLVSAAADHFAFGLMAIWILQSRRDSEFFEQLLKLRHKIRMRCSSA